MARVVYNKIARVFSKIECLALILARVVVAYSFFSPAIGKFQNLEGTAYFFDAIGIPFSYANALVAAVFEFLGVVLLLIGFLARFISIPLIVILITSIFTVHIDYGFSSSNNGFEIPAYLIVLLLFIIARGAGSISLDRLIFKDKS